jgi:hypothetical protein
VERKYPHYYAWANNTKRCGMVYRPCRIVARGRMNSVMIEFRDGTREIVSRRALRRMPGWKDENGSKAQRI